MIELVPMAYRVVNDVEASHSPPNPSTQPTNSSHSNTGSNTNSSMKLGDGQGNSVRESPALMRPIGENGVGNGNGAGSRRMDEEEERDAVFFRLESLGYRVGQGLVERYVPPFTIQALGWCWMRGI